MNNGGRLRLRDVRDVYRLIGECRELGRDPVQWRHHLLEGLSRLLDAPVAIGGMMTLGPRGLPGHRWDYIDLGWAGVAERQQMLQYRSDPRMKTAPTLERLFAFKGRLITCARERLASDREWYRSIEFNEFRRLSGIDGWLVSAFQCPQPGKGAKSTEREIDLINLHRGMRQKQFSARERRLLHLLHLELGPLLGNSLATSRDEPFGTLSPRQRDVLAALLDGESEKMVAARLRIGVRTVHDHVTALYRRFRVHSRGELMARFCGAPSRNL